MFNYVILLPGDICCLNFFWNHSLFSCFNDICFSYVLAAPTIEMQTEPIIIRLRNFQNRSYYGKITVGTQLFDVSFNSGMHDIWIPEVLNDVDNHDMRRAYNLHQNFMNKIQVFIFFFYLIFTL